METEKRSALEGSGSWLALVAALLGAYGAVRALRTLRRKPEARATGRRPRVVILGAGFGGLEAERRLRRRLPGRCEIVLIDQHNYQLFTPLLFQVATCGVDPYSITYPLRQFTDRSGVTFRAATISKIDLDGQKVQLQDLGEIGYDYLVVALGSTTNFFGIQSAQEHALPLKTVGDGTAIRNHVLDALERGAQAENPAERKALLTFVIVGGGATGVETAGALAELLSHTVPNEYPNIDPNEPRIVLVEGSGRLLGHMKGPAAGLALKKLRTDGVEVWLNTKAMDVRPDELVTEDGKTIASRTIIWSTGVRAPDVVHSIPAEHGESGSLRVDQFLQVPGRSGVYAIGDCADVEDSISHERVPWLAASAVQEGRTTAENIARAIEGRPQAHFQYRNQGNLISLGRNDGLAQFGRLALDGLLGSFLWHVVHLAKIPTLRDRIGTALDWSAGYVYDKDTARLELWPEGVGTQRQSGRSPDESGSSGSARE